MAYMHGLGILRVLCWPDSDTDQNMRCVLSHSMPGYIYDRVSRSYNPSHFPLYFSSFLRSRLCPFRCTALSFSKKNMGSTKPHRAYLLQTWLKVGLLGSWSARRSWPLSSKYSNGPVIVSYLGSWLSCKYYVIWLEFKIDFVQVLHSN